MKIFLALCLCALLNAVVVAEEQPSTAPFFALTLSAADGKPLRLDSLKGKPLVLNFWARWCGPCRKEIPDLAQMHARYQAKGLVIVGIAVEDAASIDSVREFGKAYEMNYTVLMGGVQKSMELMQALGNPQSGLPFTLLIDRQGRIVTRKLGAMSLAEMDAAIKLIL